MIESIVIVVVIKETTSLLPDKIDALSAKVAVCVCEWIEHVRSGRKMDGKRQSLVGRLIALPSSITFETF